MEIKIRTAKVEECREIARHLQLRCEKDSGDI